MEMIRVIIEVWNETTRCSALAQARTIREAANIVAAAYPKAEVRVRFPIDPEAFFVEGPATRAEIVNFIRPEEMAA
jgi:hypothetical protein